jgi:hypothetical protein
MGALHEPFIDPCKTFMQFPALFFLTISYFVFMNCFHYRLLKQNANSQFCEVRWGGTMLQAGRSRVRFPMRLILPAALWPCDRLSLCQKWVPGIFLGVKGSRRVSRQSHHHLSADCLENVGSSTSHNPMDLYGLLQDIHVVLPFLWSHVGSAVNTVLNMSLVGPNDCFDTLEIFIKILLMNTG